MTIGLTWRRTARRIKRLKEGVLTISPDYSDRLTPDFLALSRQSASRPKRDLDGDRSGIGRLGGDDRERATTVESVSTRQGVCALAGRDRSTSSFSNPRTRCRRDYLHTDDERRSGKYIPVD